MRIRDWRLAYAVLFVFAFVELVFSACPLLPHSDINEEREFQGVCQSIDTKPSVFLSAGAPSFTPRRIGDIDISTTTSKVYIATATATSGSWAIVN